MSFILGLAIGAFAGICGTVVVIILARLIGCNVKGDDWWNE